MLESSITQLMKLASALAEEMATAASSHDLAEARTCKELLLSLNVLLPKLQAARYMLLTTDAGVRCSDCEDS